MMEAGMHLGYSRSRRHPSVKESLFGTRQGGDIINLENTIEQFKTAAEFLKTVKDSGRPILFVGTKAEARDAVESSAQKLGMPYATVRWIGGTLTNAEQMKKRIELLATLEEQSDTNTFVARTKKEKLLLERKLAKLKKNFQGIRTMKGMPGALVVIDSKEEDIAVTEANQLGVPVVSLSNTDCDISLVAYPVVGNDGSKGSVKLFLDTLVNTLQN